MYSYWSNLWDCNQVYLIISYYIVNRLLNPRQYKVGFLSLCSSEKAQFSWTQAWLLYPCRERRYLQVRFIQAAHVIFSQSIDTRRVIRDLFVFVWCQICRLRLWCSLDSRQSVHFMYSLWEVISESPLHCRVTFSAQV